MAEQHYVTLEEIKARPEIPDNLSDQAAGVLRTNAEALVDAALGAWPVHDAGAAEGRKIAAADVAGWRYQRIKDATLALAARLHANPDLLGPRFESISGPDFSTSGAAGHLYGSEARTLLYGSGLVITGAHARP